MTLLLMLGQSSGILSADVRHILKTKENRHAHVELHNGSIILCIIQDEQGKVLFTNENVLKRIQSQVLQWHFDAKSPPNSSAYLPKTQENLVEHSETLSSPNLLSSYPQRTHHVAQNELLTWSRLHRTVFSLVTGSLTVERIESMLARDLKGREGVRQALKDLIKHGFVVLNQQKG